MWLRLSEVLYLNALYDLAAEPIHVLLSSEVDVVRAGCLQLETQHCSALMVDGTNSYSGDVRFRVVSGLKHALIDVKLAYVRCPPTLLCFESQSWDDGGIPFGVERIKGRLDAV